jgi:hypothetical protein
MNKFVPKDQVLVAYLAAATPPAYMPCQTINTCCWARGMGLDVEVLTLQHIALQLKTYTKKMKYNEITSSKAKKQDDITQTK